MKKWTRKFLPVLFVAALSGSFGSRRAIADDDDKNRAAAESNAPKSDAPKPGLTDRERWLLDRVEQLEKRVAELESKSQPAATPTVSAPLLGGTPITTPVAAAPTPPTTTSPASTGPANPAQLLAPAAGSVSTVNSTVAPSPSLATYAATVEQPIQDPATKKPKKSEPFAFADFTWLNGNPRTKDTPWATS